MEKSFCRWNINRNARARIAAFVEIVKSGNVKSDTPERVSSRHAGGRGIGNVKLTRRGRGYRYRIVIFFSGTKPNLSHHAVNVKCRYQIVIIGHRQRLLSMSSRHAEPLSNRYKVFRHQIQPIKKNAICQVPLPNRYKVFGVGSEASARRLRSIRAALSCSRPLWLPAPVFDDYQDPHPPQDEPVGPPRD